MSSARTSTAMRALLALLHVAVGIAEGGHGEPLEQHRGGHS
jgi:hypothetical protein